MPDHDAPALLAQELSFFETHRAELVRDHLGKFALIKGTTLYGTFDTDETAYAEGVTRFGRASFLVRRIERTDPTADFPALTVGLLRAHP
jgi:hypothetical protein